MTEDTYELKLHELIKEIAKGLDEANTLYGTHHGFIGLLIRDPTIGNIDVIHNCKKIKDVIKILQLTIDQLQKE